MTYPYGTKGAPVVGNGLGGLPRRAVATAAATAAGPRLFQRVGDFVQVNTSVSNPGYPIAWGRKIGVDEGKMFFKWRRQDGGGNTNFVLSGAAYSGSGVTAALSESNFGTTADFWSELSFANSWTSGDSAYFYDRINNQIVRVSAPSTSVVRTTVKSNAIPATGNFTVGPNAGNAYSVVNTSSFTAGDNSFLSGPLANVFAFALPDGGVLIFRLVQNTTLSIFSFAGFVFDSSWNLVRSFLVRQVHSSATSIQTSLLLVLPVSGSTELFSVFSVCGNQTSTVNTACSTVNHITGVTTNSQIRTTAAAATTWLANGSTTYTHTRNSVQIFYHDTSLTTTRLAVFATNSDFSVVSNATPTNTTFQQGYVSMPVMRYYDPEFGDYYSTGNATASLEPFVNSLGSQFFFQAVPTLQEVTNLSYSRSPESGEISSISAKGITVIESEDQSATSDLGAGPLPLARVSANAYVGAYYDSRTGANQTILRAQLMRLPS